MSVNLHDASFTVHVYKESVKSFENMINIFAACSLVKDLFQLKSLSLLNFVIHLEKAHSNDDIGTFGTISHVLYMTPVVIGSIAPVAYVEVHSPL